MTNKRLCEKQVLFQKRPELWAAVIASYDSPQGGTMIVTVSNVVDFDQFLHTFSNEGVAKRKEHGCNGAYVVRDPDDAHRVWAFFDWAREDYEGFLADPEIPAIARKLALREPPVEVELVAQYDA